MITFRDTHCHLSEGVSAEQIAAEGRGANVTGLLLCASDFAEADTLLEVTEKIPETFFAAGIHPHTAESWQGEPELFRKYTASPKLKAVGEIGLDFFYDFAPKEQQIRVFEAMLQLALTYHLPASIHCRDKDGAKETYEITLSLLRDFARDGGRFVIHCYTGPQEFVEPFAELGAYFGIGGMVTFRRADNVRELAKLFPRDRILLETDSPYLAPVPYRGKPNTPAYIPVIADFLAKHLELSCQELADLTNANASRLFGNGF